MGGSSRSSTTTTSSCFSKLLFRALVGFICLLLVATLRSETETNSASFETEYSAAEVIGREKLVRPELDLNYMSKRRVPNGPDPIHNRRAGNSGRPPGQA
ncbi:hypothetical protein FNV43_RR26092 [Rhamnella rubrinervis]|uniref:CLAVATA3/ESR (CLE)-related protein 25 n=1 Tax=Rhamnella rubrinervis TaxID=2594499 RepID=A0A8K0DJ18_9ROSA|nr:hypothetical protein FNV43_RR26092 [Rhamnella rubrinervis]